MECISIAPVVFICLFLLLFVFYPILGAYGGYWPDSNIAAEVRLKGASGIGYIHKQIAKNNIQSLLMLVIYPIVVPCMASLAYPKRAFAMIVVVLSAASVLRGYACT